MPDTTRIPDPAADAGGGPAYGIAPPGYRLPAATRLGRVRLEVADLARSGTYCERVIGLRALERSGGVLTLGPEGDGTPLVELHERPGARPVPRRGRLGLYHFAVLLPERAMLGRFAARLAALGVSAGMADHFVSEALYLTDPDGLGIEVYADRPRRAWRQRDRELYLSTEPLDLPDLVRAASGTRWTGMPAGTVIGHVHFHVADLDRAATFYHGGLGFDKTVWSYPGALFVSAGGYHHHVGTNTWAAGSPPAGVGDARLLDWELVLPGAEHTAAAAHSVAAAGFEVVPQDGGWLASDPWGTRVRLTAGQ
jgi:catechol 2,3-dioxygenase